MCAGMLLAACSFVMAAFIQIAIQVGVANFFCIKILLFNKIIIVIIHLLIMFANLSLIIVIIIK